MGVLQGIYGGLRIMATQPTAEVARQLVASLIHQLAPQLLRLVNFWPALREVAPGLAAQLEGLPLSVQELASSLSPTLSIAVATMGDLVQLLSRGIDLESFRGALEYLQHFRIREFVNQVLSIPELHTGFTALMQVLSKGANVAMEKMMAALDPDAPDGERAKEKARKKAEDEEAWFNTASARPTEHRKGIGKYIAPSLLKGSGADVAESAGGGGAASAAAAAAAAAAATAEAEPPKKRAKSGGFGSFAGW